ncbi:MAG: OsmC family protein [Nitrospinae bacterium]|nr:OsmC family protein [Nitrospinota bacterium]
MSKQTTLEQKIINGVNVSQLEETVDVVTQKPELAQFKFRANNQWQDGGHNKVKVDGYYGTCQEIPRDKAFEFDADEPPALLGNDKGANPAEYLLTALSSCMTTSLVYHAAAQGINVEAVESDYEGDINLHGFLNLDPEIRKGYEEIRVKFKVKSDADKEKLNELVQNSPIMDVVRNPTPVKVEFVTQ